MTTEALQQANLRQLFIDWQREVKKDLLKRGSFWTPTLVSQPMMVRTVVLRDLLRDSDNAVDTPLFIVHTDVRSQKWTELARESSCALHFFCSKRKWQMRVQGEAVLNSADDVAQSQWDGLSERSRRIYALQHTPGSSVDDPKAAYTFESEASGFAHFGVISIRATKLESLQLDRPDRTDYHVRASWDLESHSLTYLAP
ncbi:MAG: hypothetical protein MK096_10650 [Oleiphilaceae bacterium]|nr:hypothetical protein [Oleiphilaceae bacterium]